MASKTDNKIKEVIEGAVKGLNELIDVNTVMGKPYENEYGDFIVPVAKVTFGILSAGGEYGKVTIFNKSSDLPFSAGNGAIVSVKPCGFLIKNKENEYKTISISDNAIQNVLDKTADYLMNLQDN